MALIFCDGFDHYNEADLLQKWTFRSSDLSPGVQLYIRPQYARPPGGMGISLNQSNDRFLNKTIPSIATVIVGGNFYFVSSGPTTAGTILSLRDDASIQIDLRFDASGHLRVTRNGTGLYTGTNVMQSNTWYHIELKATINNSTGSFEVRVDGTSTGWVPEQTSQNTRTTANNTVNQLWINSFSNGVWIDDLYILDTTGSVANTFIGQQKIITVYPTGAGNSAQFTGNYASNFANVNETAGDGDSTFNQSSTAGHIDLFDFDNVPTGTISAIQHTIQARQDAGASRTLRAKTRIAGNNYNGTSVNLTGSHRFITDPVTLNPADSAAWESTDVNGAEFGYELVS